MGISNKTARVYGIYGYAKPSDFIEGEAVPAEKTQSPKNLYRMGADFERLLKKNLALLGYSAFRVAGSRGPADLVALKPGEVLLIQCKATGTLPTTNGRFTVTSHQPGKLLSGKEAATLVALAKSCGATPILAEKQPVFGITMIDLNTGQEFGR